MPLSSVVYTITLGFNPASRICANMAAPPGMSPQLMCALIMFEKLHSETEGRRHKTAPSGNAKGAQPLGVGCRLARALSTGAPGAARLPPVRGGA